MLQIRDVSRRYGTRTVLSAVSADIGGGAVTGLLGPNGSGKSTLLHILVGLLTPTTGTVAVVDELGAASAAETRRRMGFCPDDLPQPDLLTAREYLDLVQGVRGIRVDEAAIHFMSAGLRLDEHLDSLVGTYSHGMKRKLQLIAALLHRPSVLILDEPFRGLDPESGAIVRTLITRYAEAGSAVLFSTHDIALAQRLCRDVIVLHDGLVRADGSVSEVIGDHADLEASFLAQTGLDAVAQQAADDFFTGLAVLDEPGALR